TGKPKPEVKWFKDGQEIFADGTRLSTRVDNDGTFNLIIKDAKLSDAGQYSAKIINKAGTTESKAELEVVEDLEPPEFVQKLKSLELTEGQNAELVIVVTGKPEPKIEWFKNGQPIQIDGKQIIEKIETNGKRILILNDTKMDDTGNYSAKATNKAGTSETKAKVYVGEYIEAPKFTEKLKDLTINETETAIFECTVVGKPKPE
uniref:Ig-like domain-containing protein n=1 Tax=Panagrolaimus sp. JU765 TaxID=591449 RepID=A0AC34Q7H5_9BILA